MKIIRSIEPAIKAFKQGKLVAIPTETVYGLAAPIDQEESIRKIFEIKNRPSFDPLIVHVSDLDQAQSLVLEWPEEAKILTSAFWPGPLTIVLPKKPNISDLITAGLSSVAIRMPRHPLTLELIENLKIPLAAPSANIFGKVSPTTAEHVALEFPEADILILDGGPSEVGLESTVVEIKNEELRILRPGMISKEVMQVLLNGQIKIVEEEGQASPGHTKSHYQPEKPVVIIPETLLPLENETKNKIIKSLHLTSAKSLELTLEHDPFLCARSLYGNLRKLSYENPDYIYVIERKDQQSGPWIAIWNRLSKAASLDLRSAAGN